MLDHAKRRAAPALATAAVAVLTLSACQATKDAATATVNAPLATAQGLPTVASADSDMAGVLLALQALGPKPIETLSPAEARQQPTMADGVKKYLADRGQDSSPSPKMERIRNVTIRGPGGPIPARVYTPAGSGPFPIVVYYHGGGWVIADLDTYDASARAIAAEAGAVVVSSHYRQGPENKFPAAHEDAVAAYGWALENAGSFNGDRNRVAVVGESAGGNLALNVARSAPRQGLAEPDHQVLIYPVAGADLNTPSYQENENAKPLNKAMVAWFVENYIGSAERAKDPMIDLVNSDLSGLPPTTIVTAEIDPLRSEGQLLAERLRAAGVPVEAMDYEGVTHEFFGAAPAVADAKSAQAFVGGRLRQAFGRGS